jgi:hypothetical protein
LRCCGGLCCQQWRDKQEKDETPIDAFHGFLRKMPGCVAVMLTALLLPNTPSQGVHFDLYTIRSHSKWLAGSKMPLSTTSLRCYPKACCQGDRPITRGGAWGS